MGKKLAKHIVKKKSDKKSLRKKLMKKSTKHPQSNAQQNVLPNINPNQQPNTMIPNRNNLRNQLMARLAFGPLGFSPQQNGNLNNERRIDQMRQDNQTINDAMHKSEATIEALIKENKELKSEAKEKVKSVDQLMHQKEVLVAQRDEAERKGKKVDALNIQIQSITDPNKRGN